jgi:hypothetical protein
MPDSLREMIAIPIKKNSGKYRPGKSPEKSTLKHCKEKYREKYQGEKKTVNRMPGQVLLPMKNVHSIPLLKIRLFQRV